MGLFAHVDVQGIGNGHADDQRKNGDGIDIHTVILEVVGTGEGITDIHKQNEDEPEQEQQTKINQCADTEGLEGAFSGVIAFTNPDALHGKTAREEVGNLEEEVHQDEECTVGLDGIHHEGCNMHALLGVGADQAKDQIAAADGQKTKQEADAQVADVETARIRRDKAIGIGIAAVLSSPHEVIEKEEDKETDGNHPLPADIRIVGSAKQPQIVDVDAKERT